MLEHSAKSGFEALDEFRQLTDKELHLIDAGLDHVCGAVGHVLAPGWPVTEDLARWLEGERAVYELVSFGEGILGAAEERAHLVRYRVAHTITSGQTDPESGGPRVLAPDGRYEHTPLRFHDLAEADVAALNDAAGTLGDPGRGEDVTAALEQAGGPAQAAATVSIAARLSGLLDLAWTQDADLLRARIVGATEDVVLTGEEEAAYQRTVSRLNGMWALGSGVDRFTY